MIRLMSPNGIETWVAESRLEEYAARGYAPAAPAEAMRQETPKAERPAQAEMPKTAKGTERRARKTTRRS